MFVGEEGLAQTEWQGLGLRKGNPIMQLVAEVRTLWFGELIHLNSFVVAPCYSNGKWVEFQVQ